MWDIISVPDTISLTSISEPSLPAHNHTLFNFYDHVDPLVVRGFNIALQRRSPGRVAKSLPFLPLWTHPSHPNSIMRGLLLITTHEHHIYQIKFQK